MYITVEPAGLMMHTVKLVFDPSDPAPEDQQVRDYLSEHELEPRYHWFAEIDGLQGRECEIMQFGGCYLGRNLQNIGLIQRRVVEDELLTAEIDRHIADGRLTAFASATDAERADAMAAVIDEFRVEESFGQDDAGELRATLDAAALRQAAVRALETARVGLMSSVSHPEWGYTGETGPERWGCLADAYSLCSAGVEQSPVNLAGYVSGGTEPVTFDYTTTAVQARNNGHTVYLDFDPGSEVSVGGRRYELLGVHFHSPGEHLLDGERLRGGASPGAPGRWRQPGRGWPAVPAGQPQPSGGRPAGPGSGDRGGSRHWRRAERRGVHAVRSRLLRIPRFADHATVLGRGAVDGHAVHRDGVTGPGGHTAIADRRPQQPPAAANWRTQRHRRRRLDLRPAPGRGKKWSGRWESNPRSQLGRLGLYH